MLLNAIVEPLEGGVPLHAAHHAHAGGRRPGTDRLGDALDERRRHVQLQTLRGRTDDGVVHEHDIG